LNPIEQLACGFLWLATACAVAMLLWKPRNPEWMRLRRYMFAGAVGSIISILIFAYVFATFQISINAMRPWLLGKGLGKAIVDLWLGPLGFTVGAGAAGFAVGIVICFLVGRLGAKSRSAV
jgi:hypothetical protein